MSCIICAEEGHDGCVERLVASCGALTAERDQLRREQDVAIAERDEAQGVAVWAVNHAAGISREVEPLQLDWLSDDGSIAGIPCDGTDAVRAFYRAALEASKGGK